MHFNAFFLPVQLNPLDAVLHIQYCGKREYQCGEDVVYFKTETKPFTQNAYVWHFLEGHLSSSLLASHTRDTKTCQIHVSSTFKKTCNY